MNVVECKNKLVYLKTLFCVSTGNSIACSLLVAAVGPFPDVVKTNDV